MAQKSIDWLEELLAEKLKDIVLNKDYALIERIFKKANEMHKKEIKSAFNNGNLFAYNSNKIQSAEDYYNETFNK